ncbi:MULTISPECIES: hypothetical protein [unclassified Corallococcus]|uniref:hypothetical protein n=1 Tax=unclassified Corallococcus TaxID=2685029 RepID=UPI001A8C5A78|nr:MULTISPECIES: hypothetical protein [unclassified Corallococcus]MBN9688478.1 hypothetical protein [Corallococcus sp. NCSPR001]WAS87721.1 hypothetical protein O0N60_12260 [Corallococcus sp. NCRR]
MDALASSDNNRIRDALVRWALSSEDWRPVQAACLRLLRHPDAALRGVAAISLSHLARIHRTLDHEEVTQALQALIPDPEMGGHAELALDDIRLLVPRP